ncbi:MAG TPA: response regulator [Anaeromyxobacteraceae bacterium]|nr:response regulator [Anaeromyxobacteraceae bacterium]
MDPKRVLIVEPDGPFALSLASLFQGDEFATAVARTAAEAERAVAECPPSLLLLRAELPDVSGFYLAGRVRRSTGAAGVPIILFSSDSVPEAFAEHARTGAAADAYLAMPLDTEALTATARRLLDAGTAEPADDAVLWDGAEPAVEVRVGREEQPARPAEPAPPPVPQRERRQTLTDEDRLFLDRTFRSVSDRRQALILESYRRRPPPRRDLLSSPEGRVALLREELKEREAQIARLSELWEVREREVASTGERVHRKDVELQEIKLQAEELARKLAAAREMLLQREREHGASIQDLLLEKFGQEKELIEVVASSERRIHDLKRELRSRDDDLARRKLALEASAEEAARLERALAEAQALAEARQAEMARELARREEDLQGMGRELAQVRSALESAFRERDEGQAASRAAAEAFQVRVDEREAALRELEERLAREGEERRRLEEALRRREEEALRPAALAAAVRAPGAPAGEQGDVG